MICGRLCEAREVVWPWGNPWFWPLLVFLCHITLLFTEMTPLGEQPIQNKPFPTHSHSSRLYLSNNPHHHISYDYSSSTSLTLSPSSYMMSSGKVHTRLFPTTTLHGTGGPRPFPHQSRCTRESCHSTWGYTASPSNTLPTIRHAPIHYSNEFWDAWIPACIPTTLQGNKRSQALPPPLQCARESCHWPMSLSAPTSNQSHAAHSFTWDTLGCMTTLAIQQ